MITFKQKGKFEYQVLFNNKQPLNITLSQDKSILNNFDSVISSILAMSEIMGWVFDDHIFNFINDYQKCDTEHERYSFLKKSVNKTVQFSTVFVNVNDIDYAGFADDSHRTKDSIFFDTKNILKIVKLSQALKIFSLVQNTQTGINHEKHQKIYHQFLTLLKADHIPFKLLKFIEIISIRERKNKIRSYSGIIIDDENNISRLVFETLNFILYEGLIVHDYKRNPILFFAGIIKENMKYGGKYRTHKKIKYIDGLAKKYIDNISKRESDLKFKVNKDFLNRLYRISLLYLVSAGWGHLELEIGNIKYPKFFKEITYISPFWDLILAPILSEVTGIRYEKLKIISSQQVATISFYSAKKLNLIFKEKYQNLFELAYLIPINRPDYRRYRLKNVSNFINATLRFPINDLSRMGGSRISIARLIEDFIGKIKSTPFRSIYKGNLINDVETDTIEKETIDYIVRAFANGFGEEFKELETMITEDFERYKDKMVVKAERKVLEGKFSYERASLPDKNSKESNTDHNSPGIFTDPKIDDQYYYENTDFGRTYKYRKKSYPVDSNLISNNTPASEENFAYRVKIKNGKIIKENLNEDEN